MNDNSNIPSIEFPEFATLKERLAHNIALARDAVSMRVGYEVELAGSSRSSARGTRTCACTGAANFGSLHERNTRLGGRDARRLWLTCRLRHYRSAQAICQRLHCLLHVIAVRVARAGAFRFQALLENRTVNHRNAVRRVGKSVRSPRQRNLLPALTANGSRHIVAGHSPSTSPAPTPLRSERRHEDLGSIPHKDRDA